LASNIKIAGGLRENEPMKEHTSFRIGGPADLYAAPQSLDELIRVYSRCREESVPVFLLGGGSNILVSDKGIRGVVIDLALLCRVETDGCRILAESGAQMSGVSETALSNGLSGLEFCCSLPGSVGGAVWMNARCYERSMSDVISHVEVLDENLRVRRREMVEAEWGYKRSPFRGTREVILTTCLELARGNPEEIRNVMRGIREDREKKGHFLHPSAGSVFKNTHDFGAPTGKLIDSLGLKGTRIGDAQIAPYHGNIIINLGDAAARDVLSLMERAERAVREAYGFSLERELLLVGEW
jgi:UDP-N-acetylmuramate dehydrogenase